MDYLVVFQMYRPSDIVPAFGNILYEKNTDSGINVDDIANVKDRIRVKHNIADTVSIVIINVIPLCG